MSKLSEALGHAIKHGGSYTFSVEETAEIHRDFACEHQGSIEEIRERRCRQYSTDLSHIIVN